MSTDLLEDVREGVRLTLARFSRDQYRQMIREGILPDGDSLELIQGTILRKDRRDSMGKSMTHGARHLKSLNKLAALLAQWVASRAAFLQVQGPVALDDQNEPEPDCCLIAGTPDDFGDDIPPASRVLAVFEVAESSLPFDRGPKQRLYAEASIPVYIIVNLKEKRLDVASEPEPEKSQYGQLIEIPLDQILEVEIGDLGRLAFPVQSVF